MGLSMMRKKKKIEYVAITKKALVFEQLLKKEQGKMGELKSAFKDHYINAGKDNYASTGENWSHVGIETEAMENCALEKEVQHSCD